MSIERSGGLRWVVALPSEAASLISRFALKLVHGSPFKVYCSKDSRHWLVVSGMGKLAAAGACAHLHAVSSATKAEAWINVGIAGHKSASLGTTFLAHKVTDVATGSTWYPGMGIACGLESCAVHTVDRPHTDYELDTLYEMEAAGFFAMATKFSSLELSQSLKVVSDNANESITNISRERVLDWIDAALPSIEKVAEGLLALSDQEHHRLDAPRDMALILERWHLTVSQQHELRKLLVRLRALSNEGITQDAQCMAAPNAKVLLKLLRTKIELFPADMGEI